MQVFVEFIRSAAGPADFPGDDTPEVAMVGRSNVGKSSLINAMVRQRVARTSAAPGKTRLANIYRVARGASTPIYLVDLPGYGYARGGDASAREFEELTRAYFVREGGRDRQDGQDPARPSRSGAQRIRGVAAAPPPVKNVRNVKKTMAGLLLIDSRHPGLASDVEAWRWLRSSVPDAALVATKIDKLARGQRIRAMRELESVFEDSVLPVSAVTGEGLDELWKLIDRLANNSRRSPSRAMAPPRPSGPPEPRRKAPPKR